MFFCVFVGIYSFFGILPCFLSLNNLFIVDLRMLNICENITITAFSCCKCTAEEVFRKNVDMDQHSFYAVSGSAFFLSRIPIQILGTLTHVCNLHKVIISMVPPVYVAEIYTVPVLHSLPTILE